MKTWSINVVYLDDMAYSHNFDGVYHTDTVEEAIGRAFIECKKNEDCYLICKILYTEVG